MRGLICLLVLCMFVGAAEARGRRGGRGYSTAPSQPQVSKVLIDPVAQAIAQQRADALAAAQTLTHDIHNLRPGTPNWTAAGVRGEGIGMSSNPDPQQCPTCVVTNYVCADAHARSRSGAVYRVRLFR